MDSTSQKALEFGATPHAMTIDVEEWFHAANLDIPSYEWSSIPSRLDGPLCRILYLLERFQTKATFFFLGWVAERRPELVLQVQRAGHEIASHGYCHRSVLTQSVDEFREDIRRSKDILESIAGAPVNGYRAPRYSITRRNLWALDELLTCGFTYDSSIYPADSPHGRYGIPDAPLKPFRLPSGLWEFPLPTWSILGRRIPVATGAYLRLLPLWITQRAFRQNEKNEIPVVVNIHPWELDADQPRRSVPWRLGLIHYTNLHTMTRRLEAILARHRFVPLHELRSRLVNCEWRMPVHRGVRLGIGTNRVYSSSNAV